MLTSTASGQWPQAAGHRVGTARVARRWTDHNGHMNLAGYLVLFDRCFARFCDRVGIGPQQIPAIGLSVFVAETHLVYRHELALGEYVAIGLRLLDLAPRKMRTYLSMVRLRDGEIVCVNEKLDLCVDLSSRRAAPFPPDVMRQLELFHARESSLPPAQWAGRSVQMRPPPADQ